MKFFFEFVTCCGPCSSGTEAKRLLVVHETRRRVGRKRGRLRGGRGGCEWRPSLSSISEDNVLVAERINNIERPAGGSRRSLKRKVSSTSQSDRARSSHNDAVRRGPLSAIVPAFAPTPFMF
ncbi:hypothetical protein Pfo_013682 [Paulownia fortunei]|nr:hypothetical protein Pfo_013682 [Paulownia fortunei]